MPKGRHLKPEFFTDKNVVSVSPLARLLYQGLWCYAADCGHLDDEPLELKMRILPGDNCDVDELLDALAYVGRVERKNGVLFLPKLLDHARVDKRYETVCEACKTLRDHAETTPSKTPPSTTNTAGPRRDHDVTTTGRQRDHDADGDGDGDGDGEVSAAAALPRRARDLDTDPDFIAFWAAYPRRTDKGHARTAWLKAVRAGAEPRVVIGAAHRFAAQVANSDPKFIAHPATWLNGERWTDEAPRRPSPADDPDAWMRRRPT